MARLRASNRDHESVEETQAAETRRAGPEAVLTPTLQRFLVGAPPPQPGAREAMALQRLAGNRATRELLAAQRPTQPIPPHREASEPSSSTRGGLASSRSGMVSEVREPALPVSRLATTAESLGETGAIGQVKALFGQSNYVNIKNELARYHGAKDPQERKRSLQQISTLILQWMAANGWGKSSGNQSRKAKLMALDDEVRQELHSMELPTGTPSAANPFASAAAGATTSTARNGSTSPTSVTPSVPDTASEAASERGSQQQEREPDHAGPTASPRDRPPLAPQQSMVKARAILSLQGQLHELKAQADATPRVMAKVELMKKASTVLQRLLPMLDDPHVASVQKATAEYERVLLDALPSLEKQAQYMGDLEAGQDKFAYLSLAGVQAISDAITLARGETRTVDAGGSVVEAPGMGSEALRIMQQTGMTDAEVAAIKIYTAPDYRYINAGMAKNRGGWLTSAIRQDETGARSGDNRILGQADLQPGFSGPRSPADMAASEGVLHGVHAVQGLKKMPPWRGQTFRGAGFTPDEFQEQYGGGVWSAASFTSTSTEESVSREFAKRESTGGKIGVLMVFEVTEGRDIKDLSIYAKEGEILLLPGARATIAKIETHRGPPEIKIVRLRQTG